MLYSVPINDFIFSRPMMRTAVFLAWRVADCNILEVEASGTVRTVKTEANGGSKSTNERGPFLLGLLCLSCRYKSFFPALAALL